MSGMTTAAKLVEMLTENTGRSFLDSGDAYGRAWERNQGRDLASFEAAPSLVIDEFGAALDLFHWLRDRVSFDAELDAAWQAFDAANPDGYWHDLVAEWVESIGGAAADDWGLREWVNSYNHDNWLNGTIQFLTFQVDYQIYYALQIHGGADVRGGYTKPAIFSGDDFSLFDFMTLFACCSNLDCDFRVQLDGGGRIEDSTADTPDGWEIQHGCPVCKSVMTA